MKTIIAFYMFNIYSLFDCTRQTKEIYLEKNLDEEYIISKMA